MQNSGICTTLLQLLRQSHSKKPKKQKTTLSVVHSSSLASNVIPIIKNIFFDTMSKEIFISKANVKNSSKYVI